MYNENIMTQISTSLFRYFPRVWPTRHISFLLNSPVIFSVLSDFRGVTIMFIGYLLSLLYIAVNYSVIKIKLLQFLIFLTKKCIIYLQSFLSYLLQCLRPSRNYTFGFPDTRNRQEIFQSDSDLSV